MVAVLNECQTAIFIQSTRVHVYGRVPYPCTVLQCLYLLSSTVLCEVNGLTPQHYAAREHLPTVLNASTDAYLHFM